MFFFYFFFYIDPAPTFKRGDVCEIVKNDRRHNTMPKLFPDRIGERVVITEVRDNCVWAHDHKPVKYRENSKGRLVVQYDPRCVSSNYDFEQLKLVVDKPKPNSFNDWLRT